MLCVFGRGGIVVDSCFSGSFGALCVFMGPGLKVIDLARASVSHPLSLRLTLIMVIFTDFIFGDFGSGLISGPRNSPCKGPKAAVLFIAENGWLDGHGNATSSEKLA